MVVVEQPNSPNGGSEFKYCARQIRLWGHPKGPSGARDRTFQAPYSPGSALSVGDRCFGPRAQVPPLWAKKKCQKGAKPKPATGMAGRDAELRGPGHHWGHRLSRVNNAFPCAALNPTTTRMHTAVVTL